MQYCRRVAKWGADSIKAEQLSKCKRNVNQNPISFTNDDRRYRCQNVNRNSYVVMLFWATLGGTVQTHLRFDWMRGTSGENSSQWKPRCRSGLNPENFNRRAALPSGEATGVCANINEIRTESIKYGFWLHEICRLTKSCQGART